MSRTAVTLKLDPEIVAALERWAADELRGFEETVDKLLREALERAGRGRRLSRSPYR